MSRPAQTDLAVLAALSIEPMTGYTVRDVIHTRLGSFWSESFGQVYPALARLRAEGLVDSGTGDRTGSSIHRLTDAGRARLVELMLEPPVSTRPRNGVLLRLFFGDAIGADACRRLVEQTRDRARALLAELEVARRETETGVDEAQRPYRLLTISAGEHSARAAIAWAEESLAVLRTLPSR